MSEERRRIDPTVRIEWIRSSVLRSVVVGAWMVLATHDRDEQQGGDADAEP